MLFSLLASDRSFAAEPEDPLSLYQEAMSEYSLRHLKQARDHLEKLIKTNPKHPLAERAKIELARVFIDQREFDKAIELLVPLSEGNPQDGNVRYSRELLLKQLTELQRFKLGIELLEKWWKDNNSDEMIGRALASFYLQSGKADEARLLLEGLLERTADRDVFQDLLKLANKTGGVENLLSSIEQRKARYRTADFLDFTTDCLIALKQDEKAAEQLRESPETAQNISLLKKLAQIDLGRKDFKRALESFSAVQKMVPLEWENVKMVGHCRFQLGDKKEAIEAWRRPLSNHLYPPNESYQLFTDVLIEHKLYDEALNAFSEARQTMGNPTVFAEERARVLETMGKSRESLEEYLAALVHNFSFKADIFEKLYKSQDSQFQLKKRLKELSETTDSIPLKKALLEVYFREEDPKTIEEILAIDASGGIFDELVFERVQQALNSSSIDFLHRLIITILQKKRQTSLAFRLASLLLNIPEQSPEQERESLAEAERMIQVEPVPDLVLKIKLLVSLGRFCLEEFNRPQQAKAFLEAALEGPSAEVAKPEVFDALLLLMRLNACQENFPEGKKLLDRAKKYVIEDSESYARLLYENAWFDAQSGEFVEALKKLKQITDDFADTMWMNDALSFGLFLTMGSTGGLDPLKKYMESERAFAVGSFSVAIDRMQDVVQIASDAPLAFDAQARVFLMSEETATAPTDLLKAVGSWILKHPAHSMVADLMMLQWRLMRRIPGSDANAIVELLKEFTERFPGDLRSRRASLALQEIMRAKGKK